MPQIFFNQVSQKARKEKKRIISTVSKIIKSGRFLNGQQNKKLEKKLLRFLKEGFVTTVASGHDALSLAISSLEVNSEDEIIFPVNAYPTAFPVCLSKGKPIPADCDINGQIDPQEIEKKLSKRTKAIIVVHLYGLVGDLEKIKNLARKKGIFLIEDCAQAFGSTYKEKPVGTFGDISCFSFYPTKNLGALGDGGAIWTKHKNLYKYFQKAKAYGENRSHNSIFLSGHSRLPEIQAGILNCYFKDLKQEFQKRKEIEKYFKKRLQEKNLTKWIRTLSSHPNSNPILSLFVIEAKKRDLLQKFLKINQIETHVHPLHPIHFVPAFSFLKFRKGDFPISERLSKSIISLPFHAFLSHKEVDFIIKRMKQFYG